MYTLIELCCGSAALSLHLLGARRPPLPYQGSKWRFRTALARHLREASFRGPPRRLELYDPGPWGVAARCLIEPDARAGVIDRLELFSRIDARIVFSALHGHRVPEDAVEYAAQYLFLQRLSYSGKAVGVRKGNWSSPGFNTSSAFGLAGTERFGEVLPMIPSLLRTIRDYGRIATPERLVALRVPAPLPPEAAVCEPTVVYIDPPYEGATPYPNGALDHGEVVRLALAWAEAGAHVMVSEARAIDELLACGWGAERLYEGRKDESPFRGKHEEWLTFTRPRASPAAGPIDGCL